MFDIGFQELLLVAIVALLVLGPERLPGALRTMGLWMGRMRRSFNTVKNEIEREIGMDEIRRQLHNEAVMEELKRIERDVRSSADAAAGQPKPSTSRATELAMAAPLPATDTAPTEPDPQHEASGDHPAGRSPQDGSTDSTDSGAAQSRNGAGPHG